MIVEKSSLKLFSKINCQCAEIETKGQQLLEPHDQNQVGLQSAKQNDLLYKVHNPL